MKKICLVMLVFVAALTLFAATNASAACPQGLPGGWCFEHNGVRVEVVTDPLNPTQFPQIVGGNSLFKYQITNLEGKEASFIDMFIPWCTPDLGDPFNRTGGTRYDLFPLGIGDPNTGFGRGLISYRTFQWSYSKTGYISFTLPGKVFAYPNAMFLNRGQGNYAYGQILSPACAQLPYHEFTPQVPYTVQKEVNIMGIDLCIESADGSGCPTSVFSCLDPGPVCNCPRTPYPDGPQMVWNKGTILDFDIPPGMLRHAWSEHDSRCPRTYWHTEGSCKIYLGARGYGSTYTYPGISGKVQKKNALGLWVGLANVEMKACNAGGCQTSIYTDSTGYYSLCFPSATNDSPWSGTVTPVMPGYTFDPVAPNTGSFTGISPSYSAVGKNFRVHY